MRTMLLALMALPLSAQYDVFAGYSALRLSAESNAGLTAANLNGWQTSVTARFWPPVGVLFDVSGNYGQRRMIPTRFQPRETGYSPVRHHLILFGPEVRLFRTRRFAANAHALIGAAYANQLVLPLHEPFRRHGRRRRQLQAPSGVHRRGVHVR